MRFEPSKEEPNSLDAEIVLISCSERVFRRLVGNVLTRCRLCRWHTTTCADRSCQDKG